MNTNASRIFAWLRGSYRLFDRRFGGWLYDWLFLLGRIAWIAVVGLTLGLFTAGIPARYAELLRVAERNGRLLAALGSNTEFYAGYFTALDLAIVLAHVLLAALIFWRRSDDGMALLAAITLVTMPLAVVKAVVPTAGALRPLANCVIYIGLVCSVVLLYLFPDGRFTPRWTRIPAILWAVVSLPAVFWPASPISFAAWPAPIPFIVLLAWAGSGLYAQVYRYRHASSPVQRQQTKWAALGLVGAILGPFGYFTPFLSLPSLSQASLPRLFYYLADPAIFKVLLLGQLVGFALFTAGLLLFPLLFAIAILRYQLFEIDILINRTLVYGALTLALALVYVGSVVILQQLFRTLIGQESRLAIVVSTLAIAALFNPLRQRIQQFIDRRFYRHKYDAAQTLARFSARTRDQVELASLASEMLAAVEETLQPAHVSLWLCTPKRDRVTG
jgi:hypothetical protein